MLVNRLCVILIRQCSLPLVKKTYILNHLISRFTQPANLRTHMKKKHEGASIKNNKCPHCQENFASVVSVHQHILEDHQVSLNATCTIKFAIGKP